MKKLLKIMGIIILMPIVLVVAFLVIISFEPMTPNNYTKGIKTRGDIEAKYLAIGITGHSQGGSEIRYHHPKQ